jgi:sulfatase maturation enzyme AslB (radical SAM superfamily)
MADAYEDVQRGVFLEGFRRLYAGLRSRTFETASKCRRCELTHNCLQCPGRALAEKGSCEEPVEFFCNLAHRHAEKIRELAEV